MTFDEERYHKEERYRKDLNIEFIVANQIDRIAQHRSNKNLEKYEESVDTLALILPRDLSEKALEYKRAHAIRYDLTQEGKQRYDDFLEHCRNLLYDANLIYKTSYIKTYE